MRRFSSILLGLALAAAVSVPVGAQTAEELETVRKVARQMGYSESDINSVLGSAPISTTSSLNPEPTMATTGGANTPEPTIIALEQLVSPPATTSADPIYGHDYFISAGVGTITSYNAPAPSSYVLGPGDEVVVDIWGATTSNVVATIQNDGCITIGDLGPVCLAGMSLSRAESSLKAQLTRIYAGLADDRGDTFVRLSVGKMKGVVINVSGEVVTPGAYTLPALASLPSAIYMAGGVTETGSVRNITLYRKGKKVGTFDLYEYLFDGKMNQNLRLQDGDVIHVEPYGSIARISGSVMRPMRYEFREGETVADLVRYSGGFTTGAQKNEVHISRQGVKSNRDFDIESARFASFTLEDGDAVSVRTYRSTNENSVTVTGPVKYPGTYAISSDIRDVASLVKAAGGLIEGAFTGYGQINRIDKDRQPTFVTFDLAEVLAGKKSIALQREDNVVIYHTDDFIANQSVRISGAVNAPGIYSFHTGMTASELISAAGGLSAGAYLARAVISHESQNGEPVTAPFNVSDAGSVILMRNDDVRIYSIGELKPTSTVSISGEVNAPGSYAFREGMTLRNLVELAMGFTDGVDMTNVQIVSRGGRNRGTVQTLNLEETPEYNELALHPYDAVSFRRLTYFREQISVEVSGEVLSPGSYVVDKPEVRISDVMARTGGFTDEAYPHGAKLVRVLTEEEIVRQRTAVMIANQTLDEHSSINLATLTDRYTIGIDLEKALSNPGSVSDVILRSGDIIEVPQMNNTVKISGRVLYPNTVAYDKNLGWKGYVSQAGGFAKRAIRRKSYAVYMNGKVAKGSGIYTEPGMEIIVPEKLLSESQKLSPVEIATIATSTTSVATLVATLIKSFIPVP